MHLLNGELTQLPTLGKSIVVIRFISCLPSCQPFFRILVLESLTEKRIKEIGTICFELVSPKKKPKKYETRLAVKKAGLFILVSQQQDK